MKTTKGRERVGLLVSKRGNSLAPRLPAESARQLGVGAGDTLIGEIASDGRMVLSADARAVGKAEFRRAAVLAGNANLKLCAGDALHLAIAEASKVQGILCLDETMGAGAKTIGLNVVSL